MSSWAMSARRRWLLRACALDPGAFGDQTLCLFDGNAAVEHGPQLLGEFLRFRRGTACPARR